MRYCCTLDLRNDAEAIRQYDAYHRAVWPEVLASIRDSGIRSMEIWRFQTRLFMILEAEPGFSFERKSAMDAANQKVQEWERLMENFQQPLPGTPPGAKWRLMDKIFETD